MKLIADSGSTKTDWALTREDEVVAQYQTQGINPFHQSEEAILSVLRTELQPVLQVSPSTIYFYGSGVRPELEAMMAGLLTTVFPEAEAEAHGDLLGAARAVCGAHEGIACILGTGANSCLYDGRQIVSNTPPLGYILGDEGSGAVLGIRFLNALYKGFLPSDIVVDFQQETGLTMADVISRVYRQPMANRFLASLAPFISRHQDQPEVRQLMTDHFRSFFSRNVVPYQRRDLAVSFVGSVAFYNQEILREAAAAEGFTVGRVLKSPIEGLASYHCKPENKPNNKEP